MTILKRLNTLSQQSWYWLCYIIGGLSLMSVALYFQYGLKTQPCVVCIQMRLWISLLIIVAGVGLLARNCNMMRVLVNLSMFGITIGMLDRSYLLLGTERGFIFADCGFDLGLPGWFAIDNWLPWLYRVEATCGYTPELAFGITMAEAMITLSVLLFFITLAVFIASLINSRTGNSPDNR
jgi:protein dithiol:quinone oxidoreductase